MADVSDVKQRYKKFSDGDVEGATDNWADDFIWDGPGTEELPGGGRHEGKDEALQTLQKAVGAWDEYSLSVDEVLSEGDTVVVLGHQEVKKDGNSDKLPVVHIWRYDGDTPKRIQILFDTLTGAKLLGIA